MGSCRVDIKWFHICKAILSKDKICGCFMEDELFKQCGDSWTCQTDWEQLRDRRTGTHNEQMWTYYEQWFKGIPMEEWPVLGCGAKVACRKLEGELCQIRLTDESGIVTDEVFFVAIQTPHIVKGVLMHLNDRFSKALVHMSPEDFHALLPKYYQGPQWAPNDPRLRGLGHFPWEEHFKGSDGHDHLLIMTYKGWGKLFMSIAALDLNCLGPVFCMGSHMFNFPEVYENWGTTHQRGHEPTVDELLCVETKQATELRESEFAHYVIRQLRLRR